MDIQQLPLFLYSSQLQFNEPTKAIIVLPEIFGLTASIKGVVDRFAKEFEVPAFGLDFFYTLTKEANDFDYERDVQKGVELMQQMTGELFLMLFDQAMDSIKSLHPSIEKFTICGFCFGGKLAYLAGSRREVKQLIVFYGARCHLPFLRTKSVTEILIDARRNDSDLQILGFYGNQDASIPEGDRKKTKEMLAEAHIYYTEMVLDAGHAFFNADRDTYEEKAANAAWAEVQGWIKKGE